MQFGRGSHRWGDYLLVPVLLGEFAVTTVIWFLLWIVACFVGYKLSKSNPPKQDDWLILFLALCFLLFISNRFPGVTL